LPQTPGKERNRKEGKGRGGGWKREIGFGHLGNSGYATV